MPINDCIYNVTVFDCDKIIDSKQHEACQNMKFLVNAYNCKEYYEHLKGLPKKK
jgi:hypothetical protein